MALPPKIICQAPLCCQNYELMKFERRWRNCPFIYYSHNESAKLDISWEFEKLPPIQKLSVILAYPNYLFIFCTQTLNDSIRFPDEYYPFCAYKKWRPQFNSRANDYDHQEQLISIWFVFLLGEAGSWWSHILMQNFLGSLCGTFSTIWCYEWWMVYGKRWQEFE